MKDTIKEVASAVGTIAIVIALGTMAVVIVLAWEVYIVLPFAQFLHLL